MSKMGHHVFAHSLRFFVVVVLVVFIISTAVYMALNRRDLVPDIVYRGDNSHVGMLPLTKDEMYVDDTLANAIFDEVKIFCWILTTRSGVQTKAAAVNFTWAPRCNKHVFIASAFGVESYPNGEPVATEQPGSTPTPIDFSQGVHRNYTSTNGETFSTITMGDVIYVDTPEGWQNLTEKSREILQLLYMTELDNFDWFLKADDDTYLIMENLRFLLKTLDPNKPAYMGYQLEPPWFDSPYMSGGAGYVFSRAGLKSLVEQGLRVKGVCRDKGSFEDLEVGRCAVKAGVLIYNSADEFDRETFHPDNLPDYIPGPPQQWLFYYSRNKPKGGSECCSQFSVSFHRMSFQAMLVFDHLLYKTNVYGRVVTGRIPSTFHKHKVMKKLPNGVPSINTS